MRSKVGNVRVKVRVDKKYNRPVARGGKVFLPDHKWHEVVVPAYRLKEIEAAQHLNVQILEENLGAAAQDALVESSSGGGGEALEGSSDGESSGDDGSDGGNGESEEGSLEDEDADLATVGDDEVDEIDLEELDYRELQALAREYGIKANQGREELIEQIAEASEAADEEE